MQYAALLVCNWSYSLFYIVSELWGSVGVSVLFWQLANDITPVAQAKRFYPLFGQLANIAPICAGQTVAYFAKMSSDGDESFGIALKVCMHARSSSVHDSTTKWYKHAALKNERVLFFQKRIRVVVAVAKMNKGGRTCTRTI